LPAQLKIWIALTICIVFFVAFIWTFANSRGAAARGRRRPGGTPPGDQRQRRSDVRVLSAAEKKLFDEAKRLQKQGKIQPAARILEQLQMPREAIQALEDAGLIHEAAKILMRMQRHNRAGVVYARHGMWDNAAQCFKLANMPLEVAKCAREAGNYEMAADYFQQVGRNEDAGECLERLDQLAQAAHHYLLGGNRTRAVALLARLGRATADHSDIQLHSSELQLLVETVSAGQVEPGLVELVVSQGQAVAVILGQLEHGLTRPAAELFKQGGADLPARLMSEVGYQDKAAHALAEMFAELDLSHYSGMLYERMGEFGRAGTSFEAAQDFERAVYCYERAGQDDKARAIKGRRSVPTSERPLPQHANRRGPSFSLSSVPATEGGRVQLPDVSGLRPAAPITNDDEASDAGEAADDQPRSAFGEGNNESTALIEIARASPPPAPAAARAAVAKPASGPGMRPGAPIAPPPPGNRSGFRLSDDETASRGAAAVAIDAGDAGDAAHGEDAFDDAHPNTDDAFDAQDEHALDPDRPEAASSDDDASAATDDDDAPDTDDAAGDARGAFADTAPTQMLRSPGAAADAETHFSQGDPRDSEDEPEADGELTGTAGRAEAAELDAEQSDESEAPATDRAEDATSVPFGSAVAPEQAAPEPQPVAEAKPVPAPAAAPAPARAEAAKTTADPTPIDPALAAFHKAKFLADLDFDQRSKLWAIGSTLDFAEGTTILTYNDEPKGVYAIIQGAVSCYRHVGGKDVYVDQMGESETFGELWLLADQPTAVKFVAAKATRIRIIDRNAFNDLMDKDGTIARKVYKRFTLRLLKRLLKPQNAQRNQAAS
jgi:tetratricopeptide (TPR) repeat protein